MTQEDKELLLKDLCARLPYGVKGYVNNRIETLEGINIPDSIVEYGLYCNTDISEFIPYLFPLSSMTEEQLREYKHLVAFSGNPEGSVDFIDWFNKNHFDYRFLIEKGLAIDATGLNIY